MFSGLFKMNIHIMFKRLKSVVFKIDKTSSENLTADQHVQSKSEEFEDFFPSSIIIYNFFSSFSVKMISGKATEYKLLWIGSEKSLKGVGIFFAKKWLDKVIDTSRVSDRMIFIKSLNASVTLI